MSQLLLDKLDWFSRAWLSWMWAMSIHVAILVFILCVIQVCLRGASARLRFSLWLLVLLRLVIPPTVSAPTGWMWWTDTWWPAATAWIKPPLEWNKVVEQSLRDTADSDVSSQPSSAISSPTVAPQLVSWHVSLFAIWLGAIIAQLGLMIYGWLLVENWLSQARDINDARTLAILASARQRVGLRRMVRLRDSGHCTTPLVVGWFRPIILLPTAIVESLKPAELEAVLVHELTHLSRGDCWWRLIQSLLRTLYFFHPAVWIAHRALSRTCEEACDELTVSALSGQRRDYAEAIFKAATIIGYQGPHLAMNMLGEVLPVKRRLARILDPHLPQNNHSPWRHAAIAMCLACVLLPVGSGTTQAIPPSAARLSDLRFPLDTSSGQLEADQSSANTQPADVASSLATPPGAGESEQASQLASQAERLALQQLRSEEFETRMQAYEVLSRIGTTRALPDLEAAFLNRSGIEQDAAERALKHVWQEIRDMPAQTNTSARIFQAPQEDF